LPHFTFRSYDEPVSFSETIFLFILALVVFGPKKLPEIARQAGKLLAELRRASNEFKSQIETEINHLETQKETQKKQELLSATGPPKGAVASLSPAASEALPQETSASLSLAAPAEATLAGSGVAMTNLAEANVIAENSEVPPALPSASIPENEPAPATQDSHV
jgi:sec-independent protein translocase protein TatB